jgi:hypothetical protein
MRVTKHKHVFRDRGDYAAAHFADTNRLKSQRVIWGQIVQCGCGKIIILTRDRLHSLMEIERW